MDNSFNELLEREEKGQYEKIDLKKIPSRLNVFLILGIVIAALASMGEIAFTVGEAVNITLLVVFIYVISLMIYRNVYQDNMYKAKQSDEYRAAESEYHEIAKEVYDKGLASRLSELCSRYRKEELKAFRTEVLEDMCIKYGDYEKSYFDKTKKDLKKMQLSKATIKCILKANKARGIYISQDMLLSGDCAPRRRDKVFLRTSERREASDRTKHAVSGLLKTVLVGVVGISVAFDFSLEAIAQWAVRMMPVVAAALSAGPAGRSNIFDVAIPYLKKKTEVLKTMLVWADEDAKIPSAAERSATK